MNWFTSKNKISLFILFTLLCPSFVFAQKIEQTCSSAGYTILTFNGIFTNEKQAQRNKDVLKERLLPSFNGEPLTVDYVLNPSHVGGVGDLADAILQKMTEGFNVSDYDLTEMISDASKKVKTEKLLLVAHSQGNFYANSFYKEVTGIGKVPPQYVGIYGVATPASSIAASDSRHLTSDTDAVINKVRRLSPFSVLPANDSIVFPKDDAVNGHSFADIYLKYRADRIVKDIEYSLDSLWSSNSLWPVVGGKVTNKPCISPPKITAFHETIGDALVFLDSPYDTTKKSVIYVAKGTYNTLASIGNGVLDGVSDVYSFAKSLLKDKGIANNIQANVIDSEIPEKDTEIEIPKQNVPSKKPEVVVDTDLNSEQVNKIETSNPTEENKVPLDTSVEKKEPALPTEIVNPPPVFFGGYGYNATPSVEPEPDPEPEPDVVPPIITLNGASIVRTFFREIYNDLGATALDAVDGVLSVVVSGIVDTGVLGMNTITYTATDLANNVSTLSRTVIVDNGANIFNPQDFAIAGNYAYIVGDGNAMEVVDISNGANPKHVGTISHWEGGADINTPKSIAVAGNYAYIVGYGDALEIVDVSNPVLPVHKGILRNNEGGALMSHPTSVVVEGDYAYVTSYGGASFEIVDISDKAHPTHVGEIHSSELSGSLSAFVRGNYAYIVSFFAENLVVVDISDKSNPRRVGVIYNLTGGASVSIPQDVFVSGNYAYVASRGDNTFEIIDVSDPTLPIHVGKITHGSGGANIYAPISMYVLDNYAYVIPFNGDALEILDITDPFNPVHFATLSNGVGGAVLGAPISITVSGNYAYVLSYLGKTLEIIDISDKSNPVHFGKITHGDF